MLDFRANDEIRHLKQWLLVFRSQNICVSSKLRLNKGLSYFCLDAMLHRFLIVCHLFGSFISV